MFQIQLKRIDTAIGVGRLDEAFELLIATPERESRDGQRLTDLLVHQLVCRGDRHLSQDRIDDAKSDAEKAKLLAGRCDEVAELLHRVQFLQTRNNASRAAEREAASAARIQSDLGQFTLGQNLLPSGFDHSKLNAEIQRNRSIAADAAMQIQRAIDSHDLTGGIAILRALEDPILRHRLVAEKTHSLVRPMLDNALTEMREGRLDRAAKLLDMLSPVASDHAEFAELKSAMERWYTAMDFFNDAKYHDADRELAIAERVIGHCQWIVSSRESLAELQRHSSLLATGPLGLLDRMGPRVTRSSIPSRLQSSQDLNRHGGAGSPANSDRLVTVLRVDGLGAILILESETVSIGCFSKSKQFDIPIQTLGQASPILIRRVGEDYFAESKSVFQMNDQPTKRCLLTGGDSLGYGRRGRIRFRKPVPASSSAVLQ